jgi:hypothetical protein
MSPSGNWVTSGRAPAPERGTLSHRTTPQLNPSNEANLTFEAQPVRTHSLNYNAV